MDDEVKGVATAMGGPEKSYNTFGNGNFGKAINGFNNSNNFQSGVQIAGSILGSLPTPNSELNSNNQQMANIRGGVSKTLLLSGNPYAMAAGAAVMAIDKTGGFSDASQGLGNSTDTLNKMAALAAPGAGWFLGKTDTYEMSDDMKSMASGYAGSINDAQTAMQNAGAKLMFGKKKANNMIAQAKLRDSLISDIKQDTEEDLLIQQTMMQNIMFGNLFALQGGYQQSLARAAKKGGVLNKIEKAKVTLNSIKAAQTKIPEIIPNDDDFFNSLNVEEFKLGGILNNDKEFFDSLILPEEICIFKKGGEFNVIPEGALHARIHHMEGADNLTKKGIPVVSESEGGELELQAEIEVNEIIFRLDVTKKLEELWKEYKSKETPESKKNDLAIEAGKLLTCEIMENTEDRTGLIEQVV